MHSPQILKQPADLALTLIHTPRLGLQDCFKSPSCHTEVAEATMRTPASCPTLYPSFLMPPQRSHFIYIHPAAHSLVAIHTMQEMAAKLPGKRHGRWRPPHPPFSDAVRPACISGLLHMWSVYIHLGSSLRYNLCLIMLFCPLFDRLTTTET